MSNYTGSCLCRAVAFEATELSPSVAHCHCSMCRKFHGAAFATLVSVPQQAFRFLRGKELVTSFEAENGTVRSFCARCGSSLFFCSPRAPQDQLEVALAVFDSEVPVVPDANIFVDSGVSWAMGAGRLPCFSDGRASARVDDHFQEQ